MSLPARLEAWIRDDGINARILNAVMEGVFDGVTQSDVLSLGEAAGKRGYKARSPQGDAYEEGWIFAVGNMRRTG